MTVLAVSTGTVSTAAGVAAGVDVVAVDWVGSACTGAVGAVAGLVTPAPPGFWLISRLGGCAFESSSISSAERHPSATKSPAKPFLFFFFFCVGAAVLLCAGLLAGAEEGRDLDVEAAAAGVTGEVGTVFSCCLGDVPSTA